MRIEGAQLVNGLMRVQVVSKENGEEKRLVAVEKFDRDTGGIEVVCDSLPAGEPVSQEDAAVLSAIIRTLTSNYVFKHSKVEEDQEQKEKENESERV